MANDVPVELKLVRETGSHAVYKQDDGPYDRRVLHGSLYVRRSVIAERIVGGESPEKLAVTIHFPDAPA